MCDGCVCRLLEEGKVSEAENEKVKTNVKDREGALKEQIGELGELSMDSGRRGITG